MGRVHTYEGIPDNVTAIQFVRNSVGDCYDFNDKRDLSCTIKNDKVTGTIVDDAGNVRTLKGKDYIIKDVNNHISVMGATEFEARYRQTDN